MKRTSWQNACINGLPIGSCLGLLHLPCSPALTGVPAAAPAYSTNHLGHFLLVNLLLEDLKNSPKNNPAGAPRCIIVGSITGNTNTLAGNVPPKASAVRRVAPAGRWVSWAISATARLGTRVS